MAFHHSNAVTSRSEMPSKKVATRSVSTLPFLISQGVVAAIIATAFFGTGLWLLTPSWEEMRDIRLDAITATAHQPRSADPITPTAHQPRPADPIAPTTDQPRPADPITPTAHQPRPADPITPTADQPRPADPITPTAHQAVSARPPATPGNWHQVPARNVLQGQQYDQLLRTDTNFRRYRMKKECGPISDPRLRLNCLLSFSLTSG